MGLFSRIHNTLNPMNYVGGKVGSTYQNIKGKIDPFAPKMQGDPDVTEAIKQQLFAQQNPQEMGTPPPNWQPSAPPMATPPAGPVRDMSGAGGNPFAARAREMGFRDYQPPRMAPKMNQQRAQAAALRGGL